MTDAVGSAVRERAFAQVDVFSRLPYAGNPLAVVLDADGVTEVEMRRFAAWTNLSETTFLLLPTDERADYRVRIFTPAAELPFAGHPTLGSAHAWLGAGGEPRRADRIVQQCGIGLVELRREGDELAFAAPPLLRSGPLDDELLAGVTQAIGAEPADLVAHSWVDNGAGFLGIVLRDADAVLALEPEAAALGALDVAVGVIGRREGGDTDVEVRAFVTPAGILEDPVTGSLNAGFASWLIPAGLVPASYVAAQGTRLGRAGRVHVHAEGDRIWVGGASTTAICGTVRL